MPRVHNLKNSCGLKKKNLFFNFTSVKKLTEKVNPNNILCRN